MADLTKRIIEIEITKLSENGTVEFTKKFNNYYIAEGKDGLNIKFHYQKYIGSILYGKGKVSICGLDKNTIGVLTGFSDVTTELQKRRIIKIKAGYEGQELGLMVDGTILSALPTMPPDVWLNCDVMNNFEQSEKLMAFSTTGDLNFAEYCDTVAKAIGIPKVENRVKKQEYLDRLISKQSIKAGNIFNIVDSISTVFTIGEKYKTGVSSYIENETLIIDYNDLPADDPRTQNPILVNKDNGMVGLPELTNAGIIANITTLLNPSVKTGDVIQLESSQIPAANGLYYVKGITHTGEYRGNSWYTMLHCGRIENNV